MSMRRRIDNVVLRWQARLDSDWSDRVLPWLLAAGLFVVLVLLALARVRSLDGTVDLAGYTQAIWLINNRLEPVMTITQGANVLGWQAAFVIYPVSLLSHVLPSAGSLVVLQSGALAVAVVPIWRIARWVADLRAGAAIVLVAVYSLYPAVQSLNLAGFYPETLALPALLYAAHFGLSSHWRRFVVCCIFVVACRADFGLAVAGLGALVWVEGRKPEGRAVLIGGIAYTMLAVFVLEPHFGYGSDHLAAFRVFGDSPVGVLSGMVVHPGDVISGLFREENFGLFVTIFAPVAFVPLLAPRYLLPVLPLEFFFLVGRSPHEEVVGPQTIPITAFVFLASAFALARIGRRGIERITVDRRVLMVMVLAASVFFVRDGPTSPYRTPWAWGGRDAVDQARLDAIKAVGPRSVRASPALLVDLAERPVVYRLQLERPDAPEAADGVDAVILDDSTVSPWSAADHRELQAGLADLGFEQISDDGGIEVYIRGA